MVQRQVDWWPHTDSKHKFNATKTKVKQMQDMLLNPWFGFTKQLEAPVGPSWHGGLQRSDFRNPSLDKQDSDEAGDNDGQDGSLRDGNPSQGDDCDSIDMDTGAASKQQSPITHDDEQASYPHTLHEPLLPPSPSHAHSHRISA